MPLVRAVAAGSCAAGSSEPPSAFCRHQARESLLSDYSTFFFFFSGSESLNGFRAFFSSVSFKQRLFFSSQSICNFARNYFRST